MGTARARARVRVRLSAMFNARAWDRARARVRIRFSVMVNASASIPGSGRSPGEYSGSPLQYSCLENPKDRGAWQAAVHGIAKSQTQLSNNASLHVDENRKAAQNYILITLCLYS